MDFVKRNKNLVLIFLLAFFLRIILSFFGTLNLDQGTFIAWSNILVSGGFKSFYNSWSDYLPGYLYFLWFLGKINTFNILPQTVLYKLPAIISDLLTGFLIYKIISKSKEKKWGIIGCLIYLFNPAVLANSSLWGQVDSLTGLTSILSVYLLPINYVLSAMVLSFGTLIKPQVAFIFPIILFLMWKDKKNIKQFVLYGVTGLATFFLSFVPFWNKGNLLSFVFGRLNISANQYPYTSVNAFNFWSLAGFWKADNLFLQFGGYILVLIFLIFLFLKLKRTKNIEYVLMSFVFAATFTFFTRMHERHLLPVFAPLTIAVIDNPYFLVPYVIFSLTYLANLNYSFVWITDNFRQVFSDFFIKFLGVLNTSLVVFIFYVIAKNIKISWKKFIFFKDKFFLKLGKTDVKEFVLPKLKLSKNKARIILSLILTFSFVSRIFELGSPPTMYFDEVYHAFTAKVIMSSDVAKAWEWWNTPPSGFAYEWTHPPVAKLGMVLGMSIFGQNSFGWRFPGAVLGTLSILMIYLLAKEIFKDETLGLLSSAVLCLDGLLLVLNRIGMNDSYLLFFSLLSIYLFIKQKNFLSSLAFGFAVASKWSAVWAVPIFGVIFLSRKCKWSWSYLWFLFLPFAIYIGSYFDMFLTGHDFAIWWGMQKQMWWYHTRLVATHPYTSMWWTWPLMIRPIYLYTSEEIGGMVSRIYAFGNPVTFWFGLTSIIISFVYAFLERNKKLALIVFSYVIFFVPWALSPRIMFFYHYLPSIPFMSIATGYVLRRHTKLIIPFFVFASVLFIYFYPHFAGLNIPLWLDKSYYWFSSWR